MRAVVVSDWMSPRDLTVSEVPEPSVGAGSVLIDVKAAGCNFFDLLIVQGKYQVKPALPFTPGAEVAGVVRELGVGVSGLAVGDRVLANVPYGGFAERVKAPAPVTRKIPAGMSFEEAAGIPIVYGTSHAALVYRARVQPGETVLVTAAAGGVGLSSVQLAKALGAKVLALAGGDEKLAVVREAGADVAIDYRKEDWVARVQEETDGRGVDVVLENVGGDIFHGCTKCLAWDARLVVVGFAGGSIPEIKANRILLKHVSIVGLHWGPMLQHQPEKVHQGFADVFQLYEQGKVSPKVYQTYPLEHVAEALAALASRKTFGKVVLVP